MNFKGFIKDVAATANNWLDKIPPYSTMMNRKEVKVFANSFADNDLNIRLIDYCLNRINETKVVYNKLIVGNLLTNETRKLRRTFQLQEALGCITTDSSLHIMAFFKNAEMGVIRINMFPMIHDDKSIITLRGIIFHELRHALDYAEGKEMPPSSDDVDVYVNSLEEARAYSEEVIFLIEEIATEKGIDKIAAIDEVINLYNTSGIAPPKDLRTVILYFLEKLKLRPDIFYGGRQVEKVGFTDYTKILNKLKQLGECFIASIQLEKYSKKKGVNFYQLGKNI